MDLFATGDKIDELESSLLQLEGYARTCALITLAWYLRQSDSKRARTLIEEAERDSVDNQDHLYHQDQGNNWLARVLLVKSELDCLFVQFESAQEQLTAATRIFEAENNTLGQGDANWIRASAFQEQGEKIRRDQCLVNAVAFYRRGGDVNREHAGIARRFHYYAFIDSKQTVKDLFAQFGDGDNFDPVVGTWIATARALCASFNGEFANAIKFFAAAETYASLSGQYRQQLLVALQRADIYATLGVLDKALQGDEALLKLALEAGWPGMIGYAQMQTGNVLRLLGEFARASAISREALATLSPMKTSSHFALNLYYMGEEAISMDDPALALTYFSESEELVRKQNHKLSLLGSLRGQADAYLRLDQPLTAHAKIVEALGIAEGSGHAEELIKVLLVLAKFYRKFPRNSPPGVSAKEAVHQQVMRIVEEAKAVAGFELNWEVTAELGKLCASIQAFEMAYDFAQQAARGRERSRLLEISDREMIQQIGQDSEWVKRDTEYHKTLAKKETARVASLQEANTVLETLGTIGRIITASLETDQIYAVFVRYVAQLIPTKYLFIYSLDGEGTRLCCTYASIDANAVPLDGETNDIALGDTENSVARCARERIDIIEVASLCLALPQFDKQEKNEKLRSMFSPLLIGDSLSGVVAIQIDIADNYSQRDMAIFKLLCSYLLVALENANAYEKAEVARRQADNALEEMKRLQQQLIHAEKLASLGRLVSGISHELNTPLGNSLMLMSSLSEKLEEFKHDVQENGLKRQRFESFLQVVGNASELSIGNLNRSAKLINAFKQIAVDQTVWTSSDFHLSDIFERVRAQFHFHADASRHRLHFASDQGVVIHGVADALFEVLSQVSENALRHGLGEREGCLKISCELVDAYLVFTLEDDGAGIEAQHLGKIFDPFFTTTLGHGTSGLGLYIAHSIATQVLMGTLSVRSELGRGAQFILKMPLNAQNS